jgi:hypothetical protein
MIRLSIDTRDANAAVAFICDEHHKNALFCAGLDGSVNRLTLGTVPSLLRARLAQIAKIAKPTVETSG